MNSAIEFQIISWFSGDELLDEQSEKPEKNAYNRKDHSKFVVTMFGKDLNGVTYTLKIEDFTPYFYVKVPDDFTKSQCGQLTDWLRGEMQFKYKASLLRASITKRHSFRNFDQKANHKFVRFVFNNKGAMRNAVYKFQKRSKTIYNKFLYSVLKDYTDEADFKANFKNNFMTMYEIEDGLRTSSINKSQYSAIINKLRNKVTDFKVKLEPARLNIPGVCIPDAVLDLYDNMVDPLLKFIHHKDIDTVGWIRVKVGKYQRLAVETTSDLTIRTHWKQLKKIPDRGNTKIKIMAFDIECDSSHGDFPLPIKDYIKFAREIFHSFLKLTKSDPKGLLGNKAKFVNKCILAGFKRGDEELGISKIYNKPFGKIDKGYRKQLSAKIAEYLTASNSSNSILVKQHNIACISKINILLNDSKTYDELIECLIENDILESHDTERYKWEYRRITDKFPPEPEEFVLQSDITKIINFYSGQEDDEGELKFPDLAGDLTNKLPAVKGDQTIQIGMSFIDYGSRIPYKNYMLTLKGCDELADASTECFNLEKELLLRFTEIIQFEDPDVLTGWNTDGFDMPWLFKRANETGIWSEFSKMSKAKAFQSKLKTKQKKSHTGELIITEYIDIVGRIQMDLLPLVRKAYNLESYKLDRVAANFINGEIVRLDYDADLQVTTVFTKSVTGLNNENFVIFNILDGYLDNQYLEGKKFEISNLDADRKCFEVAYKIELDLSKSCKWCLGKDDVSPKDIFRLQQGSDRDRFVIAKYCMMDVILCIEILNKLELLTNNIGMANVCKNPLSWIIHRGQGVKILSLVSYFLKSKNYILPFLYKDSFDKEGYEGAVVLDPNPGIYINRPIAVLDYSSLYPSSMIEVNLSHETLVVDKQYLGVGGGEKLNELGYDFEDVTYDRFQSLYTPGGAVKGKEKVGEKTVRYVQYRDGTKGLIPQILDYLLSARKNARKKIKYKTVSTNIATYCGLYDSDTQIIKTEDGDVTLDASTILLVADKYNEFEKNVLDGLQLAFKVTANSLYGQLGAKTSDIYYKEIAASTTAVGRERLIIAKEFAINTKNYPQILSNGATRYLKNKLTYGDTDSIFVEFECIDNEGNRLMGRDARKKSIELAIYTEKEIQRTILRAPQNLEYEKTFDPFILLSKKRYVGNLYEHDPDKYKRKSMGIVLKRRDNAPIVKAIYGGIIDILMKDKDIHPAITFLKKSLRKLIKGVYPMQTLIVTKTLASYYKDPDRIAHKVLADRIGERDPGNKPKINDRIPYIYIQTDKKSKLQGDRIENPDYIIEHGLKPDYEFYITNQIMKPVSQIFALCLKDIPGFSKNILEFDNKYRTYRDKGKSKNDSIKYMLECKRKEAAKILFRDILRILENRRERSTLITDYFR